MGRHLNQMGWRRNTDMRKWCMERDLWVMITRHPLNEKAGMVYFRSHQEFMEWKLKWT